jgi:oligoribonuclease NrnB/cAMP/cGMP phosphodiesterase (DHH superfamily)
MIKVIYHGNCNDGFCCAYILHKIMPSAEFIPFNYGEEIDFDKLSPDDLIYMVDFSFKRPILEHLSKLVKCITIIDHHTTAQQEFTDLPKNVSIIFDIRHSAAYLVAESFSLPKDNMVMYTQDRDLWKFELEESKAINEYISLKKKTFEDWEHLEYDLENQLELVILIGGHLIDYKQVQIENSVKFATSAKFIGYNVGIVNSTVNFSEVAGKLAETHDFGMCWFKRQDGLYQYSLRSKGDFDVSKIAQLFGGGGHKNAAGFESKGLLC